MANPNPNQEGLKKGQWKKGQSGNPRGNYKGTKHLSTWIQEMLSDEDFEANILDSKKGLIEHKGAPMKAIIGVAIQKALNAPNGQQWAEWLAKHGYGNTLNLNVGDPLDSILTKFGISEDEEDVGKAQETES